MNGLPVKERWGWERRTPLHPTDPVEEEATLSCPTHPPETSHPHTHCSFSLWFGNHDASLPKMLASYLQCQRPCASRSISSAPSPLPRPLPVPLQLGLLSSDSITLFLCSALPPPRVLGQGTRYPRRSVQLSLCPGPQGESCS